MSGNTTPRPHPSTRLLYILALTLFAVLFQPGEIWAFKIICPPDTTVSCDAELWDLADFGTASVHTYDGEHPLGKPEWEEYFLNDCGTGKIVRTWEAYDPYSHKKFRCSQTIYVEGGGKVHITWPQDLTIESCDPATEPGDLSPPFDVPIIKGKDDPCVQIMVNYKDKDFTVYNGHDCRKILRKWTVIDWCQYDPHAHYPKGIWEHTQIIKVLPEGETVLTCPKDTTISADGDCNGGYVQMERAMAISGCGKPLSVINDSPYADEGGADASGHYPLGTTKVTFKVKDGCGGTASCSVYITVKDMKAPTPVCFYGISVSLMPMPTGPALALRPGFFDKGSFDNCTPAHKLKFRVEPEMVTCEDIGQKAVRLYVADADGNEAFCNTVVTVQDNSSSCPPTTGMISGRLTAPDGRTLPRKKVTLEGYEGFEMSDNDGEYAFPEVPLGSHYIVRPEPVSDDMEGVTALDLVVVLKHILGMAEIDNPYAYLAADIDGSGDVNVNDLLELKDLIVRRNLGSEARTAWRFADATVAVEPGTNALSMGLNNHYDIPDLETDMPGVDFIGVKVGDVSGDVNMQTTIARAPEGSGALVVRASTGHVEASEEFEVDVHYSGKADLQALQFALAFDETLVELLDAELSIESAIGEDLVFLNDNTVNIVWFDTERALESGEVFLTLRLRALATLETASRIATLASRLMPAAGYDLNSAETVLKLDYVPAAAPDVGNAADLSIKGLWPNPFAARATLGLQLEKPGDVRIDLMTADGRVYATHVIRDVEGYIEEPILSQGHSGLLICRVTALNQTRYVKMLSQTRE